MVHIKSLSFTLLYRDHHLDEYYQGPPPDYMRENHWTSMEARALGSSRRSLTMQ